MTKSLLFSLSCSGFWIGMLNAIQEICKERVVLKREYMTGLSLSAYVLSKAVVLGILCLVQSVLLARKHSKKVKKVKKVKKQVSEDSAEASG